jgi:hypothetical protein
MIFRDVLLHKYYQGNQIKEDTMDGYKDDLEDLHIDVRITLK